MEPYVIGVDIGTGSTKAIAVNINNEVIAASQYYYPMLTVLPGYAEQDVEEIWQAFTKSIQRVIAALPDMPAGISLSSAMHSVVVIGKNNKPLTNLITWADTRSEEIADGIRTSSQAETIYRVTGTPVHSMSPLCKITWLQRNAPEIFSGASKFVGIKEFIWHRIFNAYQVDHSLASASGLFNIETLKWNSASLNLCNITAAQLSETVPTSFVCKKLRPSMASLLHLSDHIPFCIGAGDGCLANIGSNALKKGIASVTIGTSGAVRVANSLPVFNFGAMTFNYVLDESTFICGGPLNNGGNVLQWVFKTFLNNSKAGANDYADLFNKIDSVANGSKGLLFLPYLNGERAPLWDEKACGTFFGVKHYHTNEHFLRAALEGVCYALHEVLQVIESSTAPVTQLNTSGGFVHSKTWMKMLADITGKRVCLVQTEDASSIGAALLGMKALKMIDSYPLSKPANDNIIEPDTGNHNLHNKYYQIFKGLYPVLQNFMHRLHNIN